MSSSSSHPVSPKRRAGALLPGPLVRSYSTLACDRSVVEEQGKPLGRVARHTMDRYVCCIQPHIVHVQKTCIHILTHAHSHSHTHVCTQSHVNRNTHTHPPTHTPTHCCPLPQTSFRYSTRTAVALSSCSPARGGGELGKLSDIIFFLVSEGKSVGYSAITCCGSAANQRQEQHGHVRTY